MSGYSLWCRIYWWNERNRLPEERMLYDAPRALVMESSRSPHRCQCALLATNLDLSHLWSANLNGNEMSLNWRISIWLPLIEFYLQNISVWELQSDLFAWQQRVLFWFVVKPSPHIALKWKEKSNFFKRPTNCHVFRVKESFSSCVYTWSAWKTNRISCKQVRGSLIREKFLAWGYTIGVSRWAQMRD